MADLLAASLAALSSDLFTLRCFFLPRPDDLSNLLLIKPRLFLLDDVSGGPPLAASDGRSAAHGLLQRTLGSTETRANGQRRKFSAVSCARYAAESLGPLS